MIAPHAPTLHAAALPFPTRQGTQAALGAMLGALHAAGRDALLLTYAHGLRDLDVPFAHARIADFPRERSERSGPSLRKVLLDVQLARALRGPARGRVVIAHHVEAALACELARVPYVFFAHTALGPELPTYVAPALGRLAARAGDAVDALLLRRAGAVCAISPALRDSLEARAGREVRYVPTPWPLPEPVRPEERAAARAGLGLPESAAVVLYAGNLDAYQGLELVVQAVSRLAARRPLTWLVASASDPSPLRVSCARAGIAASTRFVALGGEAQRRALHAACDCVVVPRGAPGGLPIKLLDALSRGAIVVATERARAGLALRGRAFLTSDDADALCQGMLLALQPGARDVGHAGRAFVAEAHGASPFLHALDTVVDTFDAEHPRK